MILVNKPETKKNNGIFIEWNSFNDEWNNSLSFCSQAYSYESRIEQSNYDNVPSHSSKLRPSETLWNTLGWVFICLFIYLAFIQFFCLLIYSPL